MKRCRTCGELKPHTEFYRDRLRGVYGTRCKRCTCAAVRDYRHRNADRVRERKRAAYHANARRHRNEALMRNYGITRAQYDELLARQGGVCAICRLPERTRANNGRVLKDLAVDHDHESGVIRGLLCAQCNKGLGNFGENSGRIRAAAVYLHRNDPHAPLLRLMAGAG